MALIDLFCITRGWSNVILNYGIRLFSKKIKLSLAGSRVGSYSERQITTIANKIRQDGFCVLDARLPDDICSELTKLATSEEITVRPLHSSAVGLQETRREVYNRNKPASIRYEFSETQLVNHPAFQILMAEPLFLAIAQEYLRCAPIADVVGMWWHTAHTSEPNAEAATMWHFDMDRIRWLKVFIYLNDVGPDNGPHCFVKGSHRPGAIPGEILERGYARVEDSTVDRLFPQDRVIEYHAPRGTIIFEDTIGLHKGKPVISGDRLICQLQFSNYGFGAIYPSVQIQDVVAPSLQSMVQQHPLMYDRFL
jgi:Phytanoyl-CoA dioxygenase (PhyH)